ncbi:MAG: acyl-ACP thioesterase [Sphaerochaetaceae bacterium]|nr:acyl-ACP thioesterase [Sphaerochaetaceae bacterium]
MLKDEIRIDGENIGHIDTYITSYDTDSHFNTKLYKYQASVQEAAGAHASAKGIGIPHLQKEGKTWVIARSRMEIYHYGVWGDKLNIVTFVQKAQGLNCPRVVEAYDQNGRKLFSTMTRWAIIDMKNGRPMRPTDIVNILAPPPETYFKDIKLPNLIEVQDKCIHTLSTYEPQIRYLDTDPNRHVNNLTYTNWIVEALPDSFNDKYKPSLVDVRWIRQTYKGEKVIVRTKAESENELEKENPKLFFEIFRLEEDGTETQVFEAWTEYKKRTLLSDRLDS